ncbi:hypothetical protein [Neoroseomonas soli]|uniref:Uncharacterized protein n=1 Tax=Neoroseomonas soli TaxID=1081025 RepID=A0A9X9WY31_9PROT|nr:hypothetical protein [Neoroseomonas soli]MBR0672060.1 hypothetical protein [Neoroseomonas soli]
MEHNLVPGRRGACLAALGLLAACTNRPPPPVVSLPMAPGFVLTDPVRQSILHTGYAFATRGSMNGRPWEAAQAISEVEFLAVELDANQRWIEMSGLAKMALVQARPEWRGALGIAADAQPQAVIDAMTRVRLAYGAQDSAAAAVALQPPLFTPGGASGLARLNELPPLPRTARAAMLAQQELMRMDSRNRRDDWQ